MKKEREYFFDACFSEDLQQFYKDYVSEKKDRIQLFDEYAGKLEHKYWKPSNICTESGDKLDRKTIDVKVSYWTPNLWKPIRKDLKAKAQKEEAYACQTIDCSCNDCAFLDRAKSFCTKKNKRTEIWSNTAQPQNLECFKHRLDK